MQVIATELTATDVPDGTYFVRVRAVNGAGVSAPSAEVAVARPRTRAERGHCADAREHRQRERGAADVAWTCTFCVEYGANAINNTFGTYGSAFSSTSIRNTFSQYGSPYSSYSACNQFASTPPRVYSGDGRIYYGELTLNPYRLEAITASGVVSWLANDVCQ